MKLGATMLALTMVGQGPGPESSARRYDGVAAVATPSVETPSVETPSVETPAVETPTPVPTQADVPAPSGIDPSSPSGLSGRRLALQRTGVAAIILGAGGYAAMVVGLGLGAAADDGLAPLRGRDDIERRRELVARGQLGNRLATGAGIAAGVVFALGITLVAVARRRGRASTATAQRRPAP